ncbi:hypothetical protein MYCOZU1_00010 [Mycobacterium intracellulare subsp. chimaera]|nr:hypothetical protein MYCODSM44623_00010 [Mycobacterium intracellulare subsp. chimaera]ASL18498.1 hypothetical protein MYCOZU1_00010 [Mycobacterium intracellulare subsp. chimaera]ETZ26184.1 hypothetical protein L842_5487 [Mycobacterium intracellulare MIN_052511_1280]
MRNREGASTVGSLAANPLQLLKMTRAMVNEVLRDRNGRF